MKTFNYKKYKNCFFVVGTYLSDPSAMYIGIENKQDGMITDCTVYMRYTFYETGTVTIKNYSENSNMTNFLKSLKIVKKVYNRVPCNNFSETLASLKSENPQTIDECEIDIDLLKEYSKEWDYNYEKQV